MFLFSSVPTVEWEDIKKGDFIIDVRSKDEYRNKSVKNTKNVPLETLDNFNTDKKVFVMCHSGGRSKGAVKALRKRGIEAYNISGGIMSYGK